MSFVQDYLPLLNIVLLAGLTLGGILAVKKGFFQEAGQIQESVIDALKEEVASLRRKVDDLEKERSTQDQVIATIRYLLKQYGLRITIAGDVVTVNDASGKSKITRIQKLPVKHDDDDDTDAI